jgi:hypothetical protein
MNERPSTPPLPTKDHINFYETALEFYVHEVRTLGERTNAFLVFQSIFVAAVVLLVASKQEFPIAFDILTLGIVFIGAISCILHHMAGKSGAQTSSIWRSILINLEIGQPNAPLNRFREIYFNNNYPSYMLDQIPLPSAWLIYPAIFVGVWVGIFLYTLFNFLIAQNNEQKQFHQAPCWLISILAFAAGCALLLGIVVLIHSYCWWRTHRDAPSK